MEVVLNRVNFPLTLDYLKLAIEAASVFKLLMTVNDHKHVCVVLWREAKEKDPSLPPMNLQTPIRLFGDHEIRAPFARFCSMQTLLGAGDVVVVDGVRYRLVHNVRRIPDRIFWTARIVEM